MVLATGRALQLAESLAASIAPNAKAMRANMDDGTGLIFAEALSFALSAHMPRPDAQAAVKRLVIAVRDGKGTLPALAAIDWPDHDLTGVFDPVAQLGSAPAEASAFARNASVA